MLALFIDLSLFVALTLALSPLLPGNRTITTIAALAGFVILTSYYYFAATWLLWGKTVGGAIFDVKVIGDGDGVMSVKAASLRWIGLVASLLTAGLGFVLAGLPGRMLRRASVLQPRVHRSITCQPHPGALAPAAEKGSPATPDRDGARDR